MYIQEPLPYHTYYSMVPGPAGSASLGSSLELSLGFTCRPIKSETGYGAQQSVFQQSPRLENYFRTGTLSVRDQEPDFIISLICNEGISALYLHTSE
jgi:hypothetical protein